MINNTIQGNGRGREWDSGGIHVHNLNARGIILRNNIVSDNLSFSIAIEPTKPPMVTEVAIDHNLVNGYRGYWRENRGTDAVMGSPRFADANGADFHLLEDSAAIDKGSPEAAPPLDFDGRSRPRGNGFDIGAYEFGQ